MKTVALLALAAAGAAAYVALGRPADPIAVHRAPADAWPALATARVFFYTELHEKLHGQWGAAYGSLYSTHRRVASRWAYVRCERATPFPAELQSLQIVSVRKAPVHLPGSTHTVPGVAVRTEIELAGYGPRDPIAFTYTFHLVPVHGHWAWLLSEQEYRTYAGDGCGLRPRA